MRPPKRVSARPKIVRYLPCDQRWTLKDRKLLLEGLKRYGTHDVELLQREYLPDRQITDIEHFLFKMQKKGKRTDSAVADVSGTKKAPIEVWLTKAEDLTKNEQDYSYALADIFSMFGNLEPHDGLSVPQGPNWTAVYQYLATLLHGGMPPVMMPTDAMILLDLIDTLAEDLKKCDTKNHRLLMQLKYQLLTVPSVGQNRLAHQTALRKALEEDPLEKLKSTTANTSQESQSHDPQPSTSSNQQSDCPSTPRVTSTRLHTSANQPEANTFSPNQASASESRTQTPKSSSTNQEPDKRSPGKKGISDVRPQKTPLYTLNPFCIPIKYMQLK